MVKIEEELETIQLYLHQERTDNQVASALTRLKRAFQRDGEVPPEVDELDEAILEISQHGHSFEREQDAQAALDALKSYSEN